MTQTLIGIDSTGTGCLKITKGNLDPITTPDSDAGAFLYNSKFSVNPTINSYTREPFRGGEYNYPLGSSPQTATFRSWQRNTSFAVNDVFYTRFNFPSLNYDFPLFSVLQRSVADGYYDFGGVITTTNGYQNTGIRTATKPHRVNGVFGWKQNAQLNSIYQADLTYSNVLDFVNTYDASEGSSSIYSYLTNDLLIWNLPGDGAGIIDAPALSPVPGMKAISLTSAGLRVAKPGYDVDTAVGTQLAFDSSRSTSKIVAAGDIDIPSGFSTYTLPTFVPDTTICEINFYQGSQVFYPTNPRETPIGARWKVQGNQILFSNANEACRARFMVIAFDDTPPTSGNNNVLRQFTENGQNVVQFLRPGAGDNPSFADIVIDSRYPAIRLLSQGYIGVGDGAQVHTVGIDTTSFYPIVRYMTVHSGYGGVAGGTNGFSKRVCPPITAKIRRAAASGGTGWFDAGDSTYSVINSNSVQFYTFRGSPVLTYFATSNDYQNGKVTNDPIQGQIEGIRYYIFGIPK